MSIGTNKSPEACPAAKKCGGCAYQGISYEEQLKIKTDKVRRLLRDLCPVRAVVGMENPYHYRNKIHAAFGRLRDGRIISGIYQEGTHKIVPVDDCLIEDETADAIIRDIRGLLPSFKIQIYNEDSGRGLLRHVLIRRGFATGQVLVALVLASPILPSKNNFVRALRKLHPEITTIVLNINDKKTSMVLGERNITLYGKGYIEDILCGKTFRISPNSFYQVNPVQTERLYRKAVELAGLTGKERVMDAYCGIGTIGMAAADQAGEVIGVELNRAAVRDAISSAKANGVKNIRFMAGDAGEFLEDMAARGERADVVFMDPPRAGSTEKFMDSVAKMGAGRVVYVSCNPETLARDLKYLKRKGYVAEEAWVVDMFPWTESIETVCLLGKRKPDTTVKIGIDMEDYRRIRDEEKAE